MFFAPYNDHAVVCFDRFSLWGPETYFRSTVTFLWRL